jgi:UDP-sulfoquinovose synthase
MYFSRRGHKVGVVDGFQKRRWEEELGVEPLLPVPLMGQRVDDWRAVSGKQIDCYIGDLTDWDFVDQVFRDFRPTAVVHFGEQPSAPYSMISREHAIMTQVNNVVGTLQIIHAMRDLPGIHLVKLGSMGEYGTPNIDIEEGYLEIQHNGRSDLLPFPKLPHSFYHLSKVHDSHNLHFACRMWKLAVTDLNQGVVYGIETDETRLDPETLATSFHYDEVFGTVLNRFCVQAVAGVPLTVYGKGGQTRGFLNIRDTLRCVELAVLHPAAAGEFRVFNQFTEQFTVRELAECVRQAGRKLGLRVEVAHVRNPRMELEQHYYNAKHDKLLQLGLEPRLLSETLLDSVLRIVLEHRSRIRVETICQNVCWQPRQAAPQEVAAAAAVPATAWAAPMVSE